MSDLKIPQDLLDELKSLLKNDEYEDNYFDENSNIDGQSDNIPVTNSPIYPSAIIGDSATPLMGQFPETEYKDDNYVGNTWKALINSYYS